MAYHSNPQPLKISTTAQVYLMSTLRVLVMSQKSPLIQLKTLPKSLMSQMVRLKRQMTTSKRMLQLQMKTGEWPVP